MYIICIFCHNSWNQSECEWRSTFYFGQLNNSTVYYQPYMQAQHSNNQQSPKIYLKTLRDDAAVYKQSMPYLTKLAKKQLKPLQIIEVLQNFYQLTQTYRSFTQNRGGHQDYRVLSKVYGKQLVDVYSLIANYVIKRESKGGNCLIQILWANEAKEIELNKPDIVLILCLMSLMLIPVQAHEQDKHKQSKFNHLKNFTYIFTNVQFKTISIIEYLKLQIPKCPNPHRLSIKRTVLPNYHQSSAGLKNILSQFGHMEMSRCMIQDDNRDIEQFYGEIKVDFANKYIGGGALTFGSVQQQIMIAVHPQMYISMLISEKMNNNEALQFRGFKKYFQSQGYNANVQITGFNTHEYKKVPVAEQIITAIDAINFNREYQLDQYSEQCVMREIVKAYAGFISIPESDTVVSGNWGCGVFGGDVQVKILVQWIAATMAGKQLRYCPYGSRDKVYNSTLLTKLSKLKLGDFLKLLLKAGITYNKQTNAKQYNLRSAKRQPTIYSILLEYLA